MWTKRLACEFERIACCLLDYGKLYNYWHRNQHVLRSWFQSENYLSRWVFRVKSNCRWWPFAIACLSCWHLYNWPNVNCEERSSRDGEEVFVDNFFLVTRWFENDEEVSKLVVWNKKSIIAWRKKTVCLPHALRFCSRFWRDWLANFPAASPRRLLFNRHNISWPASLRWSRSTECRWWMFILVFCESTTRSKVWERVKKNGILYHVIHHQTMRLVDWPYAVRRTIV